ncbi:MULTISPECIES: ATP-grasp domain-containing protein [Curtobacterium]|uniref:ATP-grasp domain-containing protein n=1 Tax=Curtobacterium TaxID=2034 RepID=UPI0021C73B8A|nr:MULTISPECIES: ATP-grasp domain-containing protein [Curtobacterium]MCU0115971.1 ATP-grasp domain-containing protein [Curtobacterium flaccumfaciens]UXZ57984.1 ATP-grasp domain-containing protein [Curtobacterium sp. Arg-1]
MTRVLVVAGTPALEARIADRGYELAVVADGEREHLGQVLARIEADEHDIVERVRRSHDQEPFAAVLSLTETGLVLAARLASELGVIGNPPSVGTTLRDKAAMRARLAADGRFAVRSWNVDGRADLEAAADEAGSPLIVKPVSGSGSVGILRLESNNHLAEVWDRMTDNGDGPWIVEEFLDGPEFSVEGFTVEGTHHVVAVTEKQTDAETFVEVAHVIPARITDADRSLMVDYVREFLTLVGFQTGPSHTEVKLTNRGPRIIESHDRIGGDKIRDLVRMSTGVDLLEQTINTALGGSPDLRPSRSSAAAVRFIVASAGNVAGITLPSTPADAEIVVTVAVGDRVPPVLTSDSRAGRVVVAAASADEAAERAERLARAVRITVE